MFGRQKHHKKRWQQRCVTMTKSPFGSCPTQEQLVLWTSHVQETNKVEATSRKGDPWPASDSVPKWTEVLEVGAQTIWACHRNVTQYEHLKPPSYAEWYLLRFSICTFLDSFEKRDTDTQVSLPEFMGQLKRTEVFTDAELTGIELENPSPNIRLKLVLVEYVVVTPLARSMLVALRTTEGFVDFDGTSGTRSCSIFLRPQRDCAEGGFSLFVCKKI